MPWDSASFKAKHNKKLTKPQAKKAAEIANAILKRTGDEGLAIATANKQAMKSKVGRMYKKSPPPHGS